MPGTNMNVSEIATEFAKMFSGEPANPDLAQVMAPEIECFHCHYGEAEQLRAMGVATDEIDNPIVIARGDQYGPVLVENYVLMRQILPGFRTEDVQIHVADNSFVITYKLVGTPPESREFRIPRCAVVTLKDGLVNRIDIYEDRATTQQMGAALMGSPLLTAELAQSMAEATTRSVIRVEADHR